MNCIGGKLMMDDGTEMRVVITDMKLENEQVYITDDGLWELRCSSSFSGVVDGEITQNKGVPFFVNDQGEEFFKSDIGKEGFSFNKKTGKVMRYFISEYRVLDTGTYSEMYKTKEALKAARNAWRGESIFVNSVGQKFYKHHLGTKTFYYNHRTHKIESTNSMNGDIYREIGHCSESFKTKKSLKKWLRKRGIEG